MRYPPGDLPILSAESYDPGHRLGPSSRSATMKLKKKQTNTDGDLDDGPRKRVKRQMQDRTEQHDDDKKRSRGRPRLDIQDETAADRRRTQIRLAQRAYRNRKETAIQTLEKKVQELKEYNEEMSNAFMKLHDFVISNGLVDRAPNLAASFTLRLRNFSLLLGGQARMLAEPRDWTPAQIKTCLAANKPSTTRHTNKITTHLALRISSPATQAELLSDFSNTFNDPPLPSALDYEIVTHPTLDNASFPIDINPDFDFSNFSSSPLPSLPVPMSYAQHESTFGRRLQRTGIEAALTLITISNPPAERFNRVFGFCMMFETPEEIQRRVLRAIGRKVQENLFNWQYPFFNLGGAGTHFDMWNGPLKSSISSDPSSHRIGNQGTADIMKPGVTNGFSTGPFNADITAIQDAFLDKDMRIGLPGFKGDYLDSDEVELYLVQRGILIPPAADYVTVEIDPALFHVDSGDSATPPNKTTSAEASRSTTTKMSNPLDFGFSTSTTDKSNSSSRIPSPLPSYFTSTSTSNSNTPWTTGMVDPLLANTSPFSSQTTRSNSGRSFINSSSSSSSPSSSTSSTSSFGVGLGFPANSLNTPNQTHAASSSPQRQAQQARKKVSIDVNQLVNELVERTICLGRSPGIKRSDINDAFWKSVHVLS
ncbi:hypothetical protein B0T17DRAFT_620093 [Bombardia bombarda]|uniref:BZIP domain-containing protein n=1 Tax=Bombardia bombarda TaxID=252184 RepID=A0AA40BVN1_9PEZI|nr:hypothetical protein B0T17DRAFT_620093 [Bombardia bombarda]